MTTHRPTSRMQRGLLTAATALLMTSLFGVAPLPAGASAPATCDDNNLNLCRLVAPQTVASTGSGTGSINLTRDVVMPNVDFTTTTDFVIPQERTVVSNQANSSSYVQPVTGTPSTGLPLPAGVSAVIVSYNPYKLRFSGTPTATGTTTLEITVSAGASSPQVDVYVLTISVTADTTAPTLQTASVPATGDRITLNYNETLKSQAIAAGSFTVTVNGSPVTVSSASTLGIQTILMLASPIEAGSTVVVSYAAPGSSPIEDVVGNDALDFTSRAVTNNSTRDLTPPTLQSAVVDTTGTGLELTYDESLTARSIDPTSYAVTAGGAPVVVSAAEAIGSKVSLALSSPVETGASVQVSYVKPGNNPVEDAAGNDAANLTSQAVTNNSTRDLTPPTQRSATVDTTGLQLSVTYNESLTRVQANGRVRVMATPRASDFDVTVGGQSRTVSTVALSGSTVTLTLGSVVYSGETVKLSYTPSTGNEIEDAAGNAAAAFSQYEVTNNSTVAAPVQAAATPTTTAAQAAAPSPTATTTVAPTPEPRVVTASKKLPSTGPSVPVAPALIALSLAGMVILLVRRRVLTR